MHEMCIPIHTYMCLPLEIILVAYYQALYTGDAGKCSAGLSSNAALPGFLTVVSRLYMSPLYLPTLMLLLL